MIKAPLGPLCGPLRVYESFIREIIGDLGLDGKVEEFQQVGREAVYQATDLIYSDLLPVEKNMRMYDHIKNNIRSAIA